MAKTSGSPNPIRPRTIDAMAVNAPAARYQRGSSSASDQAQTAHTNRKAAGTSVIARPAYLMKYGVASITNMATEAASLSASSRRASQYASSTVPSAHSAEGALATGSETPNTDRNAAWVHTNSGGCSSAGPPLLFGVSQSPVRTIPFASSEYMASSYPAKSPRRMAPRNRMAAARASRRKRSREFKWNAWTWLPVRRDGVMGDRCRAILAGISVLGPD